MTEAEVIAAAELVEAETRYRGQLVQEAAEHAAEAAYQQGVADGYAQAIADVKAAQHGIVRDAELETRRWGAGGREHFADPRPGDFTGRAGPREPQAEPELEIGT